MNDISARPFSFPSRTHLPRPPLPWSAHLPSLLACSSHALARSHFVPPAPARLLGAFFPSLAQNGISTLDGREKCWRRRGKRTPEIIFQEMCLPEISLGKAFRKRARSCALPRAGPLKPTDGRQGVRLRGEARRARGTMHSATYRLNAVATMAFTGLLALCLAVSVTGKFVRGREARVSAHSTLSSVHHHHHPHTHTLMLLLLLTFRRRSRRRLQSSRTRRIRRRA